MNQYELRHVVLPTEIDELDHVSNLVYLRWALRAAVEHSAAIGWPTERYLAAGEGWVVRSHTITYLRPAREGDPILVRTWVPSVDKVSSIRHYHILRATDQTLLADASTTWAYIQFQTLRPIRVPAEIRAAFGL